MNPKPAPPSATVVIACHDPKRPLRRAVTSVLQSRAAKVLVVAHFGVNGLFAFKSVG